MKAQIILRKVTSAPVDFAELLDPCSVNRRARADRRAIAFCADEFEQNAMKPARIRILEKRGRFANVKQQDVDIAAVEDVTESRAATRLQGQVLHSCLLRNFIKRAVAMITMQQERLAKARAGVQCVNLRIDVAVGNQQVEPRVIVHVKESRAPAYIRIAGLADPGSPTDVVKSLRAHVAIERVRLLFEVRDEKTEPGAVIVIAPLDHHIPELHAFAAEGHAT